MPSPKYIRAYLGSIGIDSTLGDALCARADSLWGVDGWNVGPSGISAGGKVVVPASAYMTFIHGIAAPVPTPAPAAAPKASAVVDEGEKDDKPVSRRRHR